jgi:hypothetical protein
VGEREKRIRANAFLAISTTHKEILAKVNIQE